MKKLVLLFHFTMLLFLTGTQLTFGQSFPVQIIPQVLPPAPIYFSDYADESSVTSPLRVQLILNDLQVASKEVRLKASFEGNGIAFESNTIVSGAPLLFLESGIPLNLTNIELAPYFKFENIIGISPNVYGRAIPEGTYRFCFEVFDAFSGNRISGRTCAGTVIFQNDPPILITPLNKATVEERNPQNIFFQWTPRHINVSNVEYELSIVEIRDNQVDPQAIFLSSPPFFQTTTQSTTYLYGPADPLLLSDKNYAWRVQAKARQGAEEIGFFKNQGYSTIFVFGNTGVCDLPIGINHEVKGSTNANIFWDDITSESPEFQIRYRETGGNNEWFYSKTTANLLTIWELAPGTEYEYQIAKTCVLTESEYSPVKTFRTHLFDDDDSAYECGIAPDIDVTNETPLDNLNTGEKFTAGDFPVTVTEVNGSNGFFNGKGYVTIPYLKSIKVAVEFTNIFINELGELKQGQVVTLYDPSLSGIVDPWDFIDDVGDIINGGDHTNTDPVDFDIDTVVIVGDTIVVTGTDENGNPIEETFPYDEGDTYTVAGNNTVYGVDENGNVNELGPTAEGGAVTDTNTTGVSSGGSGTANDPSVATIADNDVVITYSEDSTAKYGWDEATSTHEKEQYPKIETQSGSTFYPIHKAVKNGDTDTFYVDVDIKKEGLTLEDLIFKTVTGLKVETEAAGTNRLKITVGGAGGYRSEEAVITYKESEEKQVVVSSFFIHHLRPRNQVNVTLIPVNGYTAPNGIETQVKGIFDTAAANLNISMGTGFTGNTANLLYEDSGFLSKHPQSFKEFYTDFKNNFSIFSSDTYYVFLFDQTVQPGQNLAGFMPRGTQFGYIFSANVANGGLESKQTVQDVVAHEIGHGVLGLKHPFESGTTAKGTDWLMDYGIGNQLAIKDWEAIGDDGIQLYLFDDDEDGEYSKSETIEKIIQLIRCQFKNNNLEISSELKTFLTENSRQTDDGIRVSGSKADLFVPSDSSFSIAKLTSVFITGTSLNNLNQLSSNVEYKLENYYHKYKLGDITINISKSSLKIFSPSENPEDFKKYLLADSKYDFKGSINDYISSLISDNDLSDQDYDVIKSIANCEAENFEVLTRTKILKLVSDKWVLSGYYEDLIFDLMGSTPQNQFDSTLEELQKEPSIYTNIFKGNENKGEKRLLDELFRIWEKSKFYIEYHDLNSNYNSSKRDVEFYREFEIEIEKFIYSKTTPDCLDDIANLSSRELSKCIAILDRNEIKLIDYDTRKDLIEKLLTATPQTLFSDGVSKNYEIAIVRLLKLVPDGFNDSDFITYLKEKRLEYTFNISSGGSGGQTESISINSPIIQILFDKIDDSKFLLSGDYRKELVDAILTRYYSSTEFNNQMIALETNISEFELEGIVNKSFEFNQGYQNIFRRLWTEAKIGGSRGLYSGSKDEYSALISKLVDNNKLDINIKQVVKKGFSFRTTILYEDDYDPFELVMLTNESNLNLIQEYNLKDAKGKPLAFPAPAILVHYIVDAADNKTRADIMSTAFDVATLVIPGGQIVKLSKLGKMAYYADKASAISSIASTAFQDSNHPELESLFKSISIATGIISLSPDALKSGTKLRDIVQKNYLNKSSSQIVRDSEKLAQHILDLSQDAFDRLSDEQIKIILQILENDSALYTKSAITFNKSRLDDVIQVLKTGRIIADDIVIRGVSKRRFWESIEEFKAKSYTEAKALDNNDWKSFEDAWRFFENENWSDLENLFSSKGWNGGWPPNNGFSSIDNIIPVENLGDDFVVDRFQTESSLGGSFASPLESYNGGTNNYNYIPNSRALREPQTQNHYHFQFRIKKNGPRSDLSVEEGPVMPWFGVSAEDAGRQIRSNIPFHELNHGSDVDKIIVHQKIQNGWRVCVTEGKEVLVDLQNKINDLLPPTAADNLADDLNSLPELKNLFKNSNSQEELIKAWERASEIFPSGSKFITDTPTLEKIATLISEGSGFRTALGNNWSQALNDILRTASDLKCSTCGNAGRIGRSSIDQFLDDIDHFVTNFNIGPNGIGEVFYNWMRGTTKNGSVPTSNQLDELHQTLRDLSKREIKEVDVRGLGAAFDAGKPGAALKEYDLRLFNNNYTEYKNAAFAKNPLSSNSQQVDQFINGYLRNIESFEKFQWKVGFDKLKSAWGTEANALIQMKKQWKAVFESRSDEIFEVIWSNQNLRNSVFDSGLTKAEAKLDFIDMINGTDDALFKFIKVE